MAPRALPDVDVITVVHVGYEWNVVWNDVSTELWSHSKAHAYDLMCELAWMLLCEAESRAQPQEDTTIDNTRV